VRFRKGYVSIFNIGHANLFVKKYNKKKLNNVINAKFALLFAFIKIYKG